MSQVQSSDPNPYTPTLRLPQGVLGIKGFQLDCRLRPMHLDILVLSHVMLDQVARHCTTSVLDQSRISPPPEPTRCHLSARAHVEPECSVGCSEQSNHDSGTELREGMQPCAAAAVLQVHDILPDRHDLGSGHSLFHDRTHDGHRPDAVFVEMSSDGSQPEVHVSSGGRDRPLGGLGDSPAWYVGKTNSSAAIIKAQSFSQAVPSGGTSSEKGLQPFAQRDGRVQATFSTPFLRSRPEHQHSPATAQRSNALVELQFGQDAGFAQPRSDMANIQHMTAATSGDQLEACGGSLAFLPASSIAPLLEDVLSWH